MSYNSFESKSDKNYEISRTAQGMILKKLNPVFARIFCEALWEQLHLHAKEGKIKWTSPLGILPTLPISHVRPVGRVIREGSKVMSHFYKAEASYVQVYEVGTKFISVSGY